LNTSNYPTNLSLLEIELKYPLGDRDVAEIWTTLTDLGAAFQSAMIERDQYFAAPDRDFAATGEAFRLRRIGKKARFTYKGPKQPGLAKTRREIEVPLGAGDATYESAIEMVAALGFKPVATVEKHREIWTMEHREQSVFFCFDDVGYIGRFLEIEILADEAEKDEAENAILSLANALSLGEPEPRSYLRMLLDRNAS
jgi:adenylate cyclase, class 2